MSRRPILAGNWKMNLLRADATAFCEGLQVGLAPDLDEKVEILLFPSFPLLDTVADALGETSVGLGGQDVHAAESGAYTGDVSAAQLLDAGCAWALCGHSERRRDHGETDERVAAKVATADSAGLIPLICIGETGDERRAGRTFEVLERQVATLPISDPSRFALAYEPVWAIGTGETATPEQAQEAHAFLRGLLAKRLGSDAAESVRILYGGSAKPENVDELYAQSDVDGFLVGGASLDSEKFSAMIRSCARSAP